VGADVGADVGAGVSLGVSMDDGGSGVGSGSVSGSGVHPSPGPGRGSGRVSLPALPSLVTFSHGSTAALLGRDHTSESSPLGHEGTRVRSPLATQLPQVARASSSPALFGQPSDLPLGRVAVEVEMEVEEDPEAVVREPEEVEQELAVQRARVFKERLAFWNAKQQEWRRRLGT
jgi:hypothetical protein